MVTKILMTVVLAAGVGLFARRGIQLLEEPHHLIANYALKVRRLLGHLRRRCRHELCQPLSAIEKAH